jgi:hypothetical protein
MRAVRDERQPGNPQHLVVPEQSANGQSPTPDPVKLRWDNSGKK